MLPLQKYVDFFIAEGKIREFGINSILNNLLTWFLIEEVP